MRTMLKGVWREIRYSLIRAGVAFFILVLLTVGFSAFTQASTTSFYLEGDGLTGNLDFNLTGANNAYGYPLIQAGYAYNTTMGIGTPSGRDSSYPSVYKNANMTITGDFEWYDNNTVLVFRALTKVGGFVKHGIAFWNAPSQNFYHIVMTADNGASGYLVILDKGSQLYPYTEFTCAMVTNAWYKQEIRLNKMTNGSFNIHGKVFNVSTGAELCSINRNVYLSQLTDADTFTYGVKDGAAGEGTRGASDDVELYLTGLPALVNFTLTANDSYNGANITNFSVTIDGVSYSTSNGEVVTHLYTNDAETYNASFFRANISTGTYFNESFNVSPSDGTFKAELDRIAPVIPNITLNPSNFFQDSSLVTNSALLLFNVSFRDDALLYIYTVNVTDENGTSFFSAFNSSLTVKTANYVYNMNTSGMVANSTYNVTLVVGDAHTAESIGDYQVTPKKDMIFFKTETGNNIKIETEPSLNVSAVKYDDRYSFVINYGDSLVKERVFHVKTDLCPLSYLPDSQFKGHFVSYCADKGGNWVDFEGAGSITGVFKYDDYHYSVAVADVPSVVEFKSVGSINSVSESYTFYFGASYQTPENSIFTSFAQTQSNMILLGIVVFALLVLAVFSYFTMQYVMYLACALFLMGIGFLLLFNGWTILISLALIVMPVIMIFNSK